MSYMWDPHYLRYRKTYKPSPKMAFSNEVTTTLQSLIDALQTRCEGGSYYPGKYFDRNFNYDCDEVYPNVFIGDGSTAKEKEYLKKIGVTHVLNTAEGKAFSMVDTDRYFYEDVGIKYLGFPLLDQPSTNISKYFNQASDFIHNGIYSGGKVYVHCLMGMSRSSTCVIAYLMLKRGMSACEAIRTIKQKRDIHPNVGFLQQLVHLDNTLKREKKVWGIWHH